MDLAVTMRTRHLYTALDEHFAFETSLKEALELSFSFGEKPLIVLTSGKNEEGLMDLHKELATRSSNSKLIVASESGHYIHYDQPELVVEAILEVVEAVQTATAL